jgi:hypothetical protein
MSKCAQKSLYPRSSLARFISSRVAIISLASSFAMTRGRVSRRVSSRADGWMDGNMGKWAKWAKWATREVRRGNLEGRDVMYKRCLMSKNASSSGGVVIVVVG